MNDSGASENPKYKISNEDLRILSDLRLKSKNKLLIGHLNINSLSFKFDQLKGIVQGKLDILVLTETKLDSSFPTRQFIIPGFSRPFRLDRNKNGGGVMIYVREDIPSKELPRFNLPDDIEGIFIELNLRKTKWLVCGLYHPPLQTDAYFFQNVSKALDVYGKTYDKFVILGDFNAEASEVCLFRFFI